MQDAEFDQYAANYQGLVDASIRISGESADYFARQRVLYLKSLLAKRGHPSRRIFDYGCGVGLAAPILRDELQAEHVCGVDISPESIAIAQGKQIDKTSFATIFDFEPNADFDVCYSSGVFHHIPPADRPGAMEIIRNTLRPGGLMALWEQNPFNPGTRWAMYNCVFDADAQTLRPAVSRRLMREHGFEVLATRYLFIFPRSLKFLRFLEPKVAPVPIGAQYVVLARRI